MKETTPPVSQHTGSIVEHFFERLRPAPENEARLRLPVFLITTVFFAEVFFMLFLHPWIELYTGEDSLAVTIADGIFMILIMVPLMDRFVLQPMKQQLAQSTKATRALEKSEGELKQVLDTMNAIVWVAEVETRKMRFISLQAERLLGYPLKEWQNSSFDFMNQIVHPEDMDALMGQLEKARRGENTAPVEIRLFRSDGEIVWVANILSPYHLEQESNALLRGLLVDITRRKKMQQELEVEQERYRRLVDTSPDAILLTNASLEILFCNQQTAQMLGMQSAAQIIGKNLDDVIAPDHMESLRTNLQATFVSGIRRDQEYEFLHQDGHRIPVELSFSIAMDDKERPLFMTAVARDVTDRNETRLALQRRNDELVILSQLGQAVVSSLKLKGVFQQVIDQLLPLYGAKCVAILLREEQDMVYAALGGQVKQSKIGHRIPDALTRLSNMMIDDQPVMLDAQQMEQAKLLECIEICECEKPKSTMIAPLHSDGRIIGIILAIHPDRDAFHLRMLSSLGMVADWAAIAISHASQHAEINLRLRETTLANQIQQYLMQSMDVNKVFWQIAEALDELIPSVQRVVIYRVNQQEQTLAPIFWNYSQYEASAPEWLPLHASLAGTAITSNQLVYSPDVMSDQRYAPDYLSPESNSKLCAPLSNDKERLGVISVSSSIPYAFSKADQAIFARLANVAALAMHTAGLYDRERQQTNLAQSLVQSAMLLSQSLEIAEVMKNLVQQTASLLECQEVGIFQSVQAKVRLVSSSVPREKFISMIGLPDAMLNGGVPISRQPFEGWFQPQNIPYQLQNGNAWIALASIMHDDNQNVILCAIRQDQTGFSADQLDRLQAISGQGRLAFQNAHLFSDLERAYENDRKMRMQIIQAEKLAAMGRMVASVAHELNNPLQTIKNCIFLTKEEITADASINVYLDMAITEINRLTKLVLQLRDVYRPSTRNQVQRFSLNDLLEDAHTVLLPHLKRSGVEWVVEESASLSVTAVRDQIKQVFINISINAIEAMQPDGGKLSVRIFDDKQGDRIGVSFSDQGEGISPENIEKLFDPFFTTRETGTGLGLAICYDILQRHNGSIEVRSQLDRGSTFTIWLPNKASIVQTPSRSLLDLERTQQD